jgi:THO complex subunit 2
MSKTDTPEDRKESVMNLWHEISRSFLLPSMSMTRSNAAFTVEVWNILRHFPITSRWCLYGEWAEMDRLYPELEARKVEVLRETKAILRRVTITEKGKDASSNPNRLSLPLAKLAHGNPCTVFTECVKQAMAYDNLVEAIAEAARALTLCGYDVLTFTILAAFSDPNRERLKEDGTTVAMWLQSGSFIPAGFYALMDGVFS